MFVILPGLSVKKVSPYGESLSQAFGAFAEEYRVYLFDRRSNAPASYSIEDMAEDTVAVIQALGIKRMSLFGASQGGMIAQCMAIRYPDLVEKLVLGSTFCRSNDTAQKVIRSWIGLAEEERGYDLNQAICKSIYSQATMDSYGEVLLSVGDRITPEEMERFIPFARSIVSFDASSGLESISCPVLVLACEEDRVTTLAGAKEIVERLHCECYVYGREYGHAVFDEAADYRPRILEFLKNKPLHDKKENWLPRRMGAGSPFAHFGVPIVSKYKSLQKDNIYLFSESGKRDKIGYYVSFLLSLES